MEDTQVITVVYQELLKVVGGASIVLAALSGFIGKVWIERISGRERKAREAELAELKANFDEKHSKLRSRLEINMQKNVLVDRVQFEHEYEIYRSAWAALFDLKYATLQLRPQMDYIVEGETEEVRMQKRIEAFADPFIKFRDSFEKNKPFFPEQVYEALKSVLDKCYGERIDFEYTERSKKEYFEEARKNHEAIVTSIDNACSVIRHRIAEVRVQ